MIQNMLYMEIIKKNRELKKSLTGKIYHISVLSNLVPSQLNDLLEYALREEAIPAVVQAGDYDNIVQDSLKYSECNLVIVMLDICNIVDGLHYKIELFSDVEYETVFQKVKFEIDLLLKNLKVWFE